ncbi:DUF6262 family protein [Clostridium boliviensis]|uniref:DUF6262 family protein n=1 Tax=Clostridium boliviensis TaxID=318465 RepID=A0ABU4GKW1_9CLOT|nr:DUF6262 family protein [Clostridium boliviensis]MDW2797625.1 DUF6262 family protein [Clostridium boliviensis]
MNISYRTELLSYFKEQADSWRTKADLFSEFPVIHANALRNAGVFERTAAKLTGVRILNNKVPKELQAKQEQQRQITINTVLGAISELRAEGHQLTIKNLMEYSGLSRSVFVKKHIRDVLVSQGIATEKESGSSQIKSKASYGYALKQKLEKRNDRFFCLRKKE